MKHHLMVGTWTPPGAIFTFEFDDEAASLKLVKRTSIPEDEPISWMAFDHARKNIYGAGMKKWSSYSVRSPTEIIHEASHDMSHDPQASSSSTNTRAIFLLPSHNPPYAVYCAPFYKLAHSGTVFSVSPSGTLHKPLQQYPFSQNTGIHGAVFDASETYLYSADLTANKIWTHRKNPTDGTLELVEGGDLDAPEPSDHPRWVEISRCGRYLWVLMEAGNRLCEYSIDPTNGLPSYTGAAYPLIPESKRTEEKARREKKEKGLYRADVVALSHSGKYLFASSRANSFSLKGYISAYKIEDTGRIQKCLSLRETSTSGGHSNAVSPCPWDDKWLAITDDEVGGIEIWKWEGQEMELVKRLDLPGEKGFGMNAIWYD